MPTPRKRRDAVQAPIEARPVSRELTPVALDTAARSVTLRADPEKLAAVLATNPAVAIKPIDTTVVRGGDPCCDCILSFYQLLTKAKEPTLVRAELFTLTGDDDNKDKDTGIFLSVKTSDATMELAGISNADSSGKDATEYNDDSYHIVPLMVSAPGATRSQCTGFRVRMWQKTNGNDTWSVDLARVTLYFNDGTNIVAERNNFSLVDDGDSVSFNSP